VAGPRRILTGFLHWPSLAPADSGVRGACPSTTPARRRVVDRGRWRTLLSACRR